MKVGIRSLMWYNEGKGEHKIAPLFFPLKAWFWVQSADYYWDYEYSPHPKVAQLISRLQQAGFPTWKCKTWASRAIAKIWLFDNIGEGHYTYINDVFIFECEEDKTSFLLFSGIPV